MKNLVDAEKFIKDKFINNGFASNFAFAMHENVSIATKKSLRDNTHGDEGHRQGKQLSEAQGDARSIVKPLLSTFHKAMTTPVLIEIFSNIVVDSHLIDILDSDKIFRSTFCLTYGKKSLRTDSKQDRENVKNLVKSDNNKVVIEKRQEKIVQQKKIEKETHKRWDAREEEDRKRKQNDYQQKIRQIMKDKNMKYNEARSWWADNKMFTRV